MVFFKPFFKYWTVIPLRQCRFIQIIPKFVILRKHCIIDIIGQEY